MDTFTYVQTRKHTHARGSPSLLIVLNKLFFKVRLIFLISKAQIIATVSLKNCGNEDVMRVFRHLGKFTQ